MFMLISVILGIACGYFAVVMEGQADEMRDRHRRIREEARKYKHLL